MKHTKEEKRQYFAGLRIRWQDAKKKLDAGEIEAIDAIIKTHGLNVSATGFFFVRLQMNRQHLDGLPYLDAKTYKGWLENGFHVKKGEKSTLEGITWIDCQTDKTDDADSYMIPRGYHLFHRSQVEAA